MKITNASTLPRLYLGLHMSEGVAEYRPDGQAPYRVFVGEETIKNMDPTFQGRPVYVGHVDGVDLAKIDQADGYVVRSFFNQADGKHWCEFLVTTDRGHEAIRSGWRLSNCYQLKNSRGGGQWHGVDFLKEVSDAEYEHLAIVQHPRYEESIILTPEEFKAYNEKKEKELKTLANSKTKKEEKNGMLNFFKRERVENGADLENTMVELPKSKKQLTVAEVVAKYDERLVNGYHCNGDERVKVGEKDMSVNELVSKHLEAEEKLMGLDVKAKANAADEADKDAKAKEGKKEGERKANDEADGDEDMENKKKNADDADKKKKDDEEKSKNEKENFEKVKNAMSESRKNNESYGELPADQIARGKNRYGKK